MENNLKDQYYKNMSIMLQMEILTFEAESIAFVVCQYLGLDTSEYSFGYISSWSSGKDVKELKASLETIRSTSNEMIDAVEQKLTKAEKPVQAIAEAAETVQKRRCR